MKARDHRQLALRTLRRFMREWAAAKRGTHGVPFRDATSEFGKVLGAFTILDLTEILTPRERARVDKRIDRLIRARISRAPATPLRRAA